MILRINLRPVATAMLTFLTAALVFVATVLPVAAQGGRKTRAGAAPSSAEQDHIADSRARAKDDLIKAIGQQKESLKALLALRENDVRKMAGQLAKLKELYTDGLISRRQFEDSEAAAAATRARADDVRKQIEAADVLHAESLLEDEIAEALPANAPAATLPPVRDYLKKTAYIRSRGFVNWSLMDAAKIESFFLSKFGRRLPVSAFGQSDLHNRWGYDHRHAMDVIVHPDSAEGQALMGYLQGAGVPFIAFRRAVPGSASGPHIHIGRPSQRLHNQ